MKQKKYVSLMLIVAMIFSMFSPGLIGPSKASAAGEVIQITNMVELYNIRNNPSGHYVLMNDIDLNGYNWTPIPNFTGILDGNGYSIKNLYINAASADYVGFFSRNSGQVKNLTLENAQVNGRSYVGALSGHNSGTITNVGVEGGEVTGQGHGVGGLVGWNSGTIQLAYTNVNVVCNGSYIGGLVGQNYRGTIRQSYAVGDVTGHTSVGGLVGRNDEGTIQEAYATSDVTGQIGIGGIVGWNGGSIQNVYATGNVKGQDYVGGLVGENGYINGNTVENGIIQKAYTTGNVEGNRSVGGLVGRNGEKDTVGYTMQTVSGQITNVFALNGQVLGSSLVGKEVGEVVAGSLSGIYAPSHAREHARYVNYVLTEEEVFEQTTYENATFDFSNVWVMDAESGLPMLKFHPAPVEKVPTFTNKPYLKMVDGKVYNIIYTVEDLDRVRITRGANYQLANDLDLSGTNWTPIAIFGGLFDGNRHKIKNLTINAATKDNVGLFEEIGGSGQVKNLVITNVQVNGKSYVGALAGRNNGTVTNVGVEDGEVTGQGYVGGLVGNNYAGTIHQAYSTVDVVGYTSVGGLVGRNESSSQYKGTIRQVYATGNVSGQSDNVGGLIGWNYEGIIQQAFATGNVTGQGRYTGGLVGRNGINDLYNKGAGTIQQAYAAGNVTGNQIVGGLVGLHSYGTIENLFALNGQVTGSSTVGKAVGNKDSTGTTSNNITTITTMSGAGHDNYVSNTITPEQALQQMTYNMAGFDFGVFTGQPIWGIDEGESLPYLVFAPFKVGYDPGTGNWMYPETGTNPEEPAPVTPEPVITPGEGQLLVEWNYPEDEHVVGAKVSLYYEGNLAQGPVTVNRPENSHLFTGLDSDKNYTVRVVYVYDDGTESEPGEEVGTPEPMEPPAPTEPPVTEPSEDGKSLTVTWDDPDHPAFTGVHLYIRPLDGEYGTPALVAPGVERYTFTGLTPGKSYAVKYSFLYGDVEIPGEETEVTMPVGDEGNPGGSDPESGGDPGNNDPGNGGNQPPAEPEKPITLRSPVLKLVNNSREGVTLEANEVENGLVYILKRKSGSEDYVEVARQDATGTGKVTFTDTTIELKTTYSYVVEVQNGNAKAESNKVTVTTPVPEDEVPFSETPGLKVTAKTADSITLEGTPIERATEYILMKKQSDGTFAEIARKSAGEALVFVDTGLQEKTTYTYRLAATNGKVSAQSAPVSVTTEALPPETPIIVTAKLVGTEPQGFVKMLIQGFMRLMGLETDEGPTVEVEWIDPSVKPQAYALYRQVNNGVIIQVKTIQQGQGTLYRDEQVEEGKTYTYYVEALKDGMRSEKAASNPVTVPVSEKNKRGWEENPLTVEQTGPNQVTVSWIPAGGQPDKYFLYRIDTANPLYKKSIKVLTGDVTEYVDNTVTKGKTYIYVIKAVYRDGPTNEHTDEFQSEPITIQ